MTQLRLQLLGIPLVWRDEQPVRFKTRKTLAALAYLAVEGGVGSREQLAGLFWPGQDLADARKNLRTTLSYVHLALGNGALAATHDTVNLDLSASSRVNLDLQVLARAQQLARASEGAAAAVLRAQLEQAVALYRGPFLDGLDIPGVPEFETWLAGQRAHWLGVVGELLERLAGLQAASGDLGTARATIERWVALEPGEERAWQRLLSLALEMGDLVGARRGWMACQDALADLGVKPGEPLLALARQIDATAHTARPWRSAATIQDGASGGLGQAPLVGRSGPLALLRQAYARAQTGQIQLVVLEGEAGIGKTRLATEFLAWAEAQGADMLIGRGFKAEVCLPYASLVAGLRARLERENAPDDLLSDLWLAELARLLPELRERYPDLAAVTEDVTLGQGRLYEAVAQLGQALAARRPLVLFLDDAQWMHAATRDLVRYLLQRWAERGMRILVILALRQDGSCQQQLAEQWLRGLDYGTVTTWLSLERLSDVEVVYLLTALAGGTPEGEQPALRREQLTAFGQWLADTCRGVPSLVIHMLQALLEEGVLRLSPVAGDDWALDVSKTVHAVRTQSGEDLVPGAIRTLIAAQMAHLDETAALLLAAGTVLGDSFSAEQLLQVAAVEERSGEDALDRLVRGKLLREVPETGEYCVDHPLVRDVLYTGLGVARRRRLHRRALAVLQAEGAPAAALERHALAAGLVMQPAQSRMPAATTGAAVPSHLSRDRVTAASARIAPADPAYLHELAPSTIHKFSARYGDLARHTVLSEGHATMHQGSSPRHAPPWDTWPGHFSHQWPWSSVLAPTPRRSAGNAAMGTHHDRSVHGHSVPGQSDGARRSPPSRPPP